MATQTKKAFRLIDLLLLFSRDFGGSSTEFSCGVCITGLLFVMWCSVISRRGS
jgi:hypothetical protein